MADLAAVASLATAGGTLVLAVATFSSVRSANRSARVAERALMAGLRPVLSHSRLDDVGQKVTFGDRYVAVVKGGRGTAEVVDGTVYLTMSLRNSGSGLAVLHSWAVGVVPAEGPAEGPPPAERFRRLSRDIYVAAGDVGFWQGAMRDPADGERPAVAAAVVAGDRLMVDLLYGDHEGGQRTVSRFTMTPADDGGWLAAVVRHWNLDRADPR